MGLSCMLPAKAPKTHLAKTDRFGFLKAKLGTVAIVSRKGLRRGLRKHHVSNTLPLLFNTVNTILIYI